ncbi:MAG: hypothetical protein HeimC3_49870 [Candidatus Heimdallarchaeota archaeon LC_3]|nr:MAG: hypothetical protein HeimC3_49870 [Candidatus Heimdallarchaeota archaeon LC_3]
MTTDVITLEKVKNEVKGKTLKVYLLLVKFKNSDLGVREIQRQLDFSSVSLASYHLDRLESLSLVTKTAQNKYKVAQILPIGKYEDFFVLKGRYLPKEAYYISFFSFATIISFFSLIFQLWGPMVLLLFSIAIVATVSSWIRFINHWKGKNEQEIENNH